MHAPKRWRAFDYYFIHISSICRDYFYFDTTFCIQIPYVCDVYTIKASDFIKNFVKESLTKCCAFPVKLVHKCPACVP